MRTRAGFLAILICVAATPPAQIVSAAPAQQQPPLSAVVRSKIDTDVRALLSSAHVPGATIAIVRGGAIVYTRGYGLRDVAKSLPADARTRYKVGSITKQFTAAAVLQLKEAGKIVLDGTWQASALSRKRHGIWRYRLVDFTFPETLPNDIFAAHTPP